MESRWKPLKLSQRPLRERMPSPPQRHRKTLAAPAAETIARNGRKIPNSLGRFLVLLVLLLTHSPGRQRRSRLEQDAALCYIPQHPRNDIRCAPRASSASRRPARHSDLGVVVVDATAQPMILRRGRVTSELHGTSGNVNQMPLIACSSAGLSVPSKLPSSSLPTAFPFFFPPPPPFPL